MMKIPGFIICGASVCGTTSLHHMLNQHPRLCLPPNRQGGNGIHFFDIDDNYHKGMEWYSRHFADCSPSSIIGQTAPSYMLLPNVPERIHTHLPDVKLIFLLRNPVERTWSHYLKKVNNGTEQYGLRTALDLEEKRKKESFQHLLRYAYVERSMYLHQIETYLAWFKREQVFFLLTEDLNSPDQSQLKKLQAFLGVEPVRLEKQGRNTGRYLRNVRVGGFISRQKKKSVFPGIWGIADGLNRTRKKPGLPGADRIVLRQKYNAMLPALETLIGRSLGHWK